MSFYIYQASAGSGKTYTLVREYLKLALKNPEVFKHILAITFTNKAAKEMKTRILTALKTLSSHEASPLKKDLQHELPDVDIKENARVLLTKILHNYSNFAVTTIDSFIHKIVKSFAFELKLPPYFELDLKEELLSERIKDMLIDSIGENPEITKIFNEFIHFIALDEENNIKVKLKALTKNISRQLFNETSPIYEESFDQIDLENYQKIMKEQAGLLKEIHDKAMKALGILKEQPEETKVMVSRYDTLVKKLETFRNKVFDEQGKLINGGLKKEIFFKKQYAKEEAELEALGFHEAIRDLKALYHQNITKLLSNRIYLKRVFDMILIKKMKELLEDYIKENDIVPISEINRRVSEIIKRDSTPFIYYKIGEYYQNYLIDEFQDTSLKQWNNLYPLIENSQAEGHLGMAVGDPKQAIYRWRGGDVRIMNDDIEKRLYDVKKIHLKNNYRSSKTIIEFNNQFFQKLLEESGNAFVQDIYASSEQECILENDGLVEFKFFNLPNKTEASERITQELIDTIEDLISEEIYDLKDIAILVNTNREGEVIANALFEKEIEVTSSESLLIAKEPIILLLINSLKWLVTPKNVLLSTKISYFLNLINDKNSRILFRKLEKFQFLDNEDIDILKVQGIERELKQLKFKREELLTYSLYEIIESLIKIFNLDKKHAKTGRYLERFLGVIKESDKNNIYSFLDWWNENSENLSLTSQEDFNAIKILTIHKAKGLEFPVVFVPFANWDYQLSSRHDIWLKSEDGLAHLVTPKKELENSTFKEHYDFEKKMYFMDSVNKLYVAFTRAISSLYVFGYYNKKENIAHLIQKTLFKEQNDGELIYQKGQLPSKYYSHKKTENYLPIQDFIISDWKSRLEVIPEMDINKANYTDKMAESIKLQGKQFGFIKKVIQHMDQKEGRVVVISPTKKASRYFQAIHRELVNEPIRAISFDDFITLNVEKKMGVKKAEFIDLLFNLIEVTGRKIEDDFNSFFNWAESVIQDFNELDRNLIDVDDFFNYITNLNEIDEQFIDLDDEIKQKHIKAMKEFGDIYMAFNTLLSRKDLVYLGRMYKYFYENIKQYISKNDYFIFWGFNTFSKAERSIIKYLLQAKQADIFFDTDDYYLENPEHEAGELLRQNIKELNLDALKWTQNEMKDHPVHISINATSTIITEIKALGSKLKDLVLEDKIHGNNTAIVVENQDYLIPLLTSLPEEIKELNVSINYPLQNTLIYRLMRTMIALNENNQKNKNYVYKKDVLNLLIHPYFKIIATEYAIDHNDLIEKIQNYSKTFITQSYLKKQVKNDEVFEHLFLKWKNVSDFIKSINFINDTLSRIILESQIFDNRKLEAVILDYFKSTTNHINDYLESLDTKITPKTVWRLYSSYFSAKRVPFDTPLFNGVQVLSLNDTRGLDFENVLFLSVNENIFPHKKENNTIIPYESRSYYKLETYETRESDVSYLFYRLIQHAKNVEIFYHDNIKDKGEKSRFVEQILLEYSSVNKHLVLENNFLTFEAQKNNFEKIEVSKKQDIIEKLKTYNFSPSLLNTYRKCSLKFYFDYILGLNKYEEYESMDDPRIFGLIFHETLEALYKGIKKVDADVIHSLKKKYPEVLKGIAKAYLEEIDKGAGRLIYNILDKVIYQVLSFDKETEFEIIALEEKLQRYFKLGDMELKLKGSADRIDAIHVDNQELLRVIDYKTGKSTYLKRVKTIDEQMDDISFQLLHYLYCYNPQADVRASAYFVMDKSKTEHPLVIQNKPLIKTEDKENIYQDFERLLSSIFHQLFDLKSHFNQCIDEKPCFTCPYSDICGREMRMKY